MTRDDAERGSARATGRTASRAVLCGLVALSALSAGRARSEEAATTPAGTATAAATEEEVGEEAPVLVAGRACPNDMVEVDGTFCPFLEQRCVRWTGPKKRRCAEFAKSGPCQTASTRKRFCIDRYEYPNKFGATPIVMKTWYAAKATCEGLGKRLCTESEWTLACEGNERLPYPYGLVRDSEACNIDHEHIPVDEKALRNPNKRDAEVARLWQGETSGAREACVSPFGVRDMTGNVDEWVVRESGKPHHSALKGGYWGYVRAMCRPVTQGHEETFYYYQVGFRCCSEVAGAASPTSTPPAQSKN
ncbi:MAG: SUMF1/EgtB/PvdO family nonheme iron enzyme [Polyangiaceae bacterium]